MRFWYACLPTDLKNYPNHYATVIAFIYKEQICESDSAPPGLCAPVISAPPGLGPSIVEPASVQRIPVAKSNEQPPIMTSQQKQKKQKKKKKTKISLFSTGARRR